MLFFRHPKPVVDGRPVAEHAVVVEQRQLPALSQPDLPPSTAAAPPSEEPIRFTARYGLGEYLAVLREHLLIVLRERGEGRRKAGRGLRWLIAVVATPLFLYKKWRVGDCHFTIDATGLTRGSRGRPVSVAWNEIVAIRRYRAAYLVEIERGAMPLPYRCFSADERRRFERWSSRSRPSGSP
jgi:hypothetical protein